MVWPVVIFVFYELVYVFILTIININISSIFVYVHYLTNMNNHLIIFNVSLIIYFINFLF